MNIKTRDFGEVEIADDSIITFPNGIIGFEDCKKFTLLSPLGEGKFPMWLQSVEAPTPCFVVYDPMEIYHDYKFCISDEEQDEIGLNEQSSYICLATAIVPDDYRKTTINLRCPILINMENMKGIQPILTEHYDFKCPVYAEEG